MSEQDSSEETSEKTEWIVRLLIAYEGGNFAGWQRQPNIQNTIQQRLETALQDVLQDPVVVSASGRTDAGVHAIGQAVHVVVNASRRGEEELIRRLVLGTNAMLPQEIRVLRADRMPPGFDARKCATSKHYRYRWWRGPVVPPKEARYVEQLTTELDLEAMQRAAAKMEGRHDFTAMAKSGGGHKSAVRTMNRVKLSELGHELQLDVEGQGFLRGMVRAMAGTLLEIGRGRRSVDSLDQLLGNAEQAPGSRTEAGPNTAACGLTLVGVGYGEIWRPLGPGFPPSDLGETD